MGKETKIKKISASVDGRRQLKRGRGEGHQRVWVKE